VQAGFYLLPLGLRKRSYINRRTHFFKYAGFHSISFEIPPVVGASIKSPYTRDVPQPGLGGVQAARAGDGRRHAESYEDAYDVGDDGW
jgi:hypothetical protein